MPKLRDMDYYVDLAEDLYDNPDNETRRDVWESIDTMDACDVEIPASIQELDFVGPNAKFAVTLPHDIIAAVGRFIATNDPRIDVMLRDPNPLELDKADGIETVLRWHYRLMNRRGRKPARVQIAENLVKYSSVAIQTRYMPYEANRKKGDNFVYSSAERKQLLHGGDFCWIVNSPRDIYPIWTENGILRSVLKVGVMSVYDLLFEYGENDTVIKAIRDANLKMDEPDTLRDEYVSYFDYMDDQNRVEWFSMNGNDDALETGEDGYELQRTEHKLGFLPWAIVDYEHPLLEGIVKSGLYDHLAVLRAIIASKALGQVTAKTDVVTTPNPDDPNIIDNENNPVGERMMPIGTTIQRLPPIPIDQQIMMIYQEFKAELVESAAARALVALESYIGGNTPATSINAAQQTAMAQLGQIRSAFESAHNQGLHQMLRWMEYSKTSSMGFRMGNTEFGDTPFTGRGAQFAIYPKGILPEGSNVSNIIEFAADDIHLNVQMSPTFVIDKQANTNQAILEQQAGLSRETSWERNGLVENVEYERAKALQQSYEDALVATDIQTMQAEAQMKIQMQAQQAQGGSPVSPDQNVRDMNGEAPFAATQGMDGRMGGPTPADVVPGETRETLNGKDFAGRPLV